MVVIGKEECIGMMNHVVAHLKDGTVVKGLCFDIDPHRPYCHIKTNGDVTEVALQDLKALFFVRDLEGNPKRVDAQEADPTDSRLRGTTQVEVRFLDNERIIGLSNRFPPRGPFFFVVPVDPASNNTRILINSSAVRSVELVHPEAATGTHG
jgi:hypothetical protein